MPIPQIPTGKPINLIQLVGAVLTVLTAALGGYVHNQIRMNTIEITQSQIQKDVQEIKSWRMIDQAGNVKFDDRLDDMEEQLKVLQTQFNDVNK